MFTKIILNWEKIRANQLKIRKDKYFVDRTKCVDSQQFFFRNHTNSCYTEHSFYCTNKIFI